MMSPIRTRLAAVLSALFLLLLPVACGSDDDGSPAGGATEQTDTAETETGEDTTEEP